jgi:hypothetical protein
MFHWWDVMSSQSAARSNSFRRVGLPDVSLEPQAEGDLAVAGAQGTAVRAGPEQEVLPQRLRRTRRQPVLRQANGLDRWGLGAR